MKITFFCGIKLRIYQVIDVFIIYCGEGRRHISVQEFRAAVQCILCQLRRLLSGPAGNLIYCINLVIYVSITKLFHYTFYLTIFCSHIRGFCSLSSRWRQSVPTYQQHGHNPEVNWNLVTHFNFSSFRAPNNHFHFDLTSVTKKHQGREISV